MSERQPLTGVERERAAARGGQTVRRLVLMMFAFLASHRAATWLWPDGVSTGLDMVGFMAALAVGTALLLFVSRGIEPRPVVFCQHESKKWGPDHAEGQ